MLCDLRSYKRTNWEASKIGMQHLVPNTERWLPQDDYRAHLSAYIEQNFTIASSETPEIVQELFQEVEAAEKKLPEEIFSELIRFNSNQYEPSMHLDGTYLEELINKRLKAKAMEMKCARPFDMFNYNSKMEAVQIPNLNPTTLLDILGPLLLYSMKQSIYNAFERFSLHMSHLMKSAIASNEIQQLQEDLNVIGCDPELMISLPASKQQFNLHPSHKKLARLASQDIFKRPGRLPIAKQDLHEYYYGDQERPRKRNRSLSPITAPSKIIFTSKPDIPSRKEEAVKNSKSALHNFFLPHVREKLSDPENEFITEGSRKGQTWILEQHKMTEDGLHRAKRYKRMLFKLRRSKDGIWAHVDMHKYIPGPDFLHEDYSQLFFDVQWRCNASDAEALKWQKEKLIEIVTERDGIRKEKSMGMVYDPSMPLMHARIVDDTIAEIDETLPKTPEKERDEDNLQDNPHVPSPQAVNILTSDPGPFQNGESCPTSDIFTEV